MKKLLIASLKHALPATLLLIQCTINAQSQPSVQKESMRAPASLKIDGKLTEWGSKLQAYNNADRIAYTIANDDTNIYLVILATDQPSLEKIGNGGITFTISPSLNAKLRQKDAGNLSVHYPVINILKSSGLGNAARTYNDLKRDTMTNRKKIDSLVTVRNQKFAEMYTTIGVKGIKAFSDSVISAFNTEGIKVAASFSHKMVYVYELAIPLKYLNIADNEKFSYNIKLNGPPSNADWLKAGKFPPPQIRRDDGGTDHDYEYINSPTDFWGEYTLAKK